MKMSQRVSQQVVLSPGALRCRVLCVEQHEHARMPPVMFIQQRQGNG